MTDYNKQFQEAYDKLNDKQREAVNEIYGPVMTLAGPGTGKTQLLTIRIGHILRETDVDIRNILCLTFTDAGAHAMRTRLKSFIGPEAYNAHIYTFHSFCTDVIKSNPDYFGGIRDLQSVTDLELVEVFREIIDEWDDDHILKRYKGDLYYEARRLKQLFETMKREGWTAVDIKAAVDGLKDYLIKLDDNKPDGEKKEWHYNRKSGDNQKGDFNTNKFEKYKAKFQKILAASQELAHYDAILKRLGRFDYADMVQWVIDAFTDHPDLLADYQERFQFLLVDEYQDTNGTQNELIFLLADNPIDDRPNVFIVGDDDQAIYRFQGANVNNIETFKDKYDPKVIVLEDNYRSYQGILDRAYQLINNNKRRLSGPGKEIEKNLKESRNLDIQTGLDPIVQRYINTTQEEYGVAKQILQLRDQGVPLDEIAIIYRKHKNVANLLKYFSVKNIPVNIKNKIDVLEEMDIIRLRQMLEYLRCEYKKPYSGNHLLFEMMHYDFFDISVRDIALVAMYCSRRTDDVYDDKMYVEVINSEELLTEAGVNDVGSILRFGGYLDGWQSMIPNVTLQVLFEQVLTQSGLLDQVLHSEDTSWRLQVINTFFNVIKDESDKKENFDLLSFMDMLDKMKEHGIQIPINKVTSSEKGVHLLTTHGAKGLEFRYVFMIRCEQENWIQKNNSQGKFSYPPNLVSQSVPDTTEDAFEDERRLFYVGMTRAQDKLYLCYSDKNEADKDLTMSQFVFETLKDESEVHPMEFSDEEVLAYGADLLRFRQGSVEIIDHDLIDRVLAKFSMSSTSLNKYLKCPLAFYFENILRVPMARTVSMGFGNAIHLALELFFKDLEKDPERKPPTVEVLHSYFLDGMRKYHSHFTSQERELSTTRGKKLLSSYYDEYHTSWGGARKYEMEYKIKTEYNGVPITGNIDRLDVYDDHIEVVDYKTGKYDAKKLKGPNGDLGGDYWRQIIFYKLLLDGDLNYRGRMDKGWMDFVEKDEENNKFNKKKIDIADFEVQEVSTQLTEAYQAIVDHKFDDGCDDEKCSWCNFVKENMPATLPTGDADEREEMGIEA